MFFNRIPEQRGLYDPAFEHDSCGVGFVCDIKGRPARGVVVDALEVLRRMAHRGATGADPDSGDGAGILVQTPDAFLRAEAAALGIELPAAGRYAAGLVFLPVDPKLAENCRSVMAAACAEAGAVLLGWRKVPVAPLAIGPSARAAMPLIEMVLVGAGRGQSDAEFGVALYLARRRAEKRLRPAGASGVFYVASLSAATMIYKGMLTPEQVGSFFLDLQDPRLESALALIHSRYSTNTFPSWDRAQPFRYLAHNGEINTLKGNSTWLAAREGLLANEAWGKDLSELFPVIQPEGSDSQALDNALELLIQAGRSPVHAMALLVPPAWEEDARLSPEVRAFHQYNRCLTESWDGPAALAFTDGKMIAAALDRNGLRPARYLVTTDGRALMASEMGVLDLDPATIAYSGRLEPGKVLFIDLAAGRIVDDAEVKASLAAAAPYGKWLADGRRLEQTASEAAPAWDDLALRAAGYTREELELIVAPMASTGAEPIGSMGNDAPLAVLSRKDPNLYAYFRQLFAQVTNPPIDPLREGCVMSLETVVGPAGNFLADAPASAARLTLASPILTEESLAALRADPGLSGGWPLAELDLRWDPAGGEAAFRAALARVCADAAKAAASGQGYLLLTDRGVGPATAALPALLAVGAVHRHLLNAGLRAKAAIFLESIEPREVHHFCLLFGYGADAVVPYGAYAAAAKLLASGDLAGGWTKVSQRLLHAWEHGLMKVLSKMGISTLMSYKGAQIFEAVGIGGELVDLAFAGTPSRVGGIGPAQLAAQTAAAHAAAYARPVDLPHLLPEGGVYRWRRNGEKHAWNPETVAALQLAVRTGSYDAYKRYAALMDGKSGGPVTLRSLLRFVPGQAVPLDEVESEDLIVKRFATGAMSFGSLSAQAHETLALAMNRLGGKSNTGEGGEDPRRFEPLPNGDSLNSKVKQVASGRFGVTTLYLSSAEEIQIKIAQGAKPGEGGQLPGHKVSAIIAKTRYTTPGVTLISPPPHHDIYSIEDLAQLISDLRHVNPRARISVKLVSEMGVGTVAAGVAKGAADMILVSGGDGGTGASPLSSIKHAGLPWELGLAETNQTLVLNGLRSKVRVQCDGGMRTGRDLAIACLLGADEFGFAAGALIAMGCTMLRHCHLNNCSMGVATQDERCAARFAGKPEYVENFMRFAARQLREIMAELGFRTVDAMVGQVERLAVDEAALDAKTAGLDFSKILWKPAIAASVIVDPERAAERKADVAVLDERMIELAAETLERGKPVRFELAIANTDRSVGARLGGEIMKRKGEAALPPRSIEAEFRGTAGQSFGAWLCGGVQFRLAGLANDYVGKGLFGGVLAVRPPEGAGYDAAKNVLIGNTALFGAIRGELYVRGRAGERFAVRNSGATAVVEGIGDHGCEYMTGGLVLVLGPTGRNFGSGMSGGVAYVHDPDGTFPSRFNGEFADLEAVLPPDAAIIASLLKRHVEMTASERAKALLEAGPAVTMAEFKKVMPRDYRAYLEAQGGK